MSESKNIYQRVLEVMRDGEYIQKGAKTVNNTYRFVSHDQVTGFIHPLLVKHGIVVIPTVKSFTQDSNRTVVCMKVQFVNVDNPTDLIEVESWGYGLDTQDKGPGKAVSYAFKYAILKMFCLETGDDPDNDVKQEYIPPEKAKQAEEDRTRKLSGWEVEKILSLLDGDKDRLQRILNLHNVESLKDIPFEKYSFIVDVLQKPHSTKEKKS